MKAGAKLAFVDNSDLANLKNNINHNTYVGAHHESGGHILSGRQPVSNYEAQSVINVIKNTDINNPKVTKTESEYIDQWV